VIINSKIRFILIGFCVAFLGAPQVATACGCYPHSTVLDDFEQSDIVVIARLVSVEKVPEGKGPYGSNINSATMIVERVFKGSVKVNEKLTFAEGHPIVGCTWDFYEKEIGRQYLLYLYAPMKPSEPLRISTCNRSRNLEYANDDLLYLNNINGARGRTRISGVLSVDSSEDVRLDGRTISIIGKHKTYVAKTDKNGVYELYDVPPGRYVLNPELDFGWKVDKFRLTRQPTRLELMRGRAPSNRIAFILRPRKHFGIDIRLRLSNHVSGTIYDSKSKPMQWVCVSLAPANDESFLVCNSLTDERGRFQTDSVAAGSYVIILNYENQITARMPFPKLYYPGVADREKAKTITLKHGESIDNLDMVIKN
jgi:hypothetical protein